MRSVTLFNHASACFDVQILIHKLFVFVCHLLFSCLVSCVCVRRVKVSFIPYYLVLILCWYLFSISSCWFNVYDHEIYLIVSSIKCSSHKMKSISKMCLSSKVRCYWKRLLIGSKRSKMVVTGMARITKVYFLFFHKLTCVYLQF